MSSRETSLGLRARASEIRRPASDMIPMMNRFRRPVRERREGPPRTAWTSCLASTGQVSVVDVGQVFPRGVHYRMNSFIM